MMNSEECRFKLNIYGDTFLKLLSPILQKWLRVDADHELTISGGKVKQLHRGLVRIYNQNKKEGEFINSTALIMIGIFDIMGFTKKRHSVKKFSRRLKKNLSVLVSFLARYHKNIILLTAIPILKMQGRKHHWELIHRYNKNMKKFTEKPDYKILKIVDIFPLFVKTGNPPSCIAEFYENLGTSQDRKDVNVLWNETGIMKAALNIAESVVNVQKLQSSDVENKVKNEETRKSIGHLSSKLEDVCLTHEGHNSTIITCLESGKLPAQDRNACCLPAERDSCSHTSHMSEIPSIYNARTFYMRNEIRQKLSWMRCTEYSSYGEQLLKNNRIKSIGDEIITVATYNVLSQELLERHSYLYSSHDQRCLNWRTRSEILREELHLLDADILCLQEVDFRLVDSFYNHYLNKRGYEGIFKRRTHGKNDGCAIYFRTNKFNLLERSTVEFFKESVRLLCRDNVGITLKLALKNRPHIELVIATTHLLYNPKRADIKLVQTQVMLAEIERLAYKRISPVSGRPEYIPIIFTGDMNYSPDSGIYQLITKSHLEYETISTGQIPNIGCNTIKSLLPAHAGITDSCQYVSALSQRSATPKKMHFESGQLDHNLNLSSVYKHIKRDFPEATTRQNDWVTVDYIFYSQPNDKTESSNGVNLKLVSKLSLPNTEEAEMELVNIPNLGCASDHFPLQATFHLSVS